MYPTDNELDVLPWYKQGWPWLLISLPASAVIGGIATIIIATQSPNAMVADDYYKEGLAINQETQRLREASELGISALVRANGRALELEIDTGSVTLSDTLTLEFIHATRAELDRRVELTRTDTGTYRAADPGLPAGNWYLKLRPENQSWELRAQARVDDGLQVRLGGIQARH